MERKQVFRLCHVCGTLNDAEEEILNCGKCGKKFLPINYFERIKEQALQSGELAQDLAELSFNPVKGLIVFW